MSEFDEMDFDEDELEAMHEGSDDALEPEDVFKLVTINRIRKKRTIVHLQDEAGDRVELKDVVKELLVYIKDKMEDEDGNQFTEQIMPLMSQAVVSGLGRMIGLHATAFHLSQQVTRASIIHMMCVALLMLKFVQQKELTIVTFEEDVTDEEIEEIERRNRANSTATLAALAGHDPRAVLEQLREQGHITDDDLKDMLNGEDEDDILTGNGDEGAKGDQ
jgi:hypothetical protein